MNKDWTNNMKLKRAKERKKIPPTPGSYPRYLGLVYLCWQVGPEKRFQINAGWMAQPNVTVDATSLARPPHPLSLIGKGGRARQKSHPSFNSTSRTAKCTFWWISFQLHPLRVWFLHYCDSLNDRVCAVEFYYFFRLWDTLLRICLLRLWDTLRKISTCVMIIYFTRCFY